MECVKICPSDIMHIDASQGRAYNIEPAMCWECFACVKACPEAAIEVRGYADFAPLNHMVQPTRTANTIEWKIRMRNGDLKEFVFPIRTTPWESIPSPTSAPEPAPEAVASELLSFEPDYLAVEALPTLPRKSEGV